MAVSEKAGTRAIGFRIPIWLWERLEADAKSKGRTITWAVEAALREAYGEVCKECGSPLGG